MNRIVSALPGRIRLRDPALRALRTNERLQTIIAKFDGVRSVEGRTKSGSVLLLYDATRIDRSAMEAQVEAAAAAELALQDGVPSRSAPPAAAPDRTAKRASRFPAGRASPASPTRPATIPGDRRGPPFSTRAILRQLNEYAKFGMIASLGASLALAAAGRKRLHIATGGVYLALLGIHLAVHRRQLLKLRDRAVGTSPLRPFAPRPFE